MRAFEGGSLEVRATGLSCVRARLVRIKTEEEKHKAAQGGVIRWWRVECARTEGRLVSARSSEFAR